MTAPEPYTPGPFSKGHYYVQFGGKLPGAEQWSCGFRMCKFTGTHETDIAPTLLPGIVAAIDNFHINPESWIAPAAKLSFVKCNSIDVDGTYTHDTTYETVLADRAGAGSGVAPPNQIAWVASLVTGYSRGPAHRGRMYLPLPTATNTPGLGTVDVSFATQLKGTLNLMRTAVNLVHPEYKMAVMSRKDGSPADRLVTGFEVGVVLDTQRRRRRSLAENYQ